MAAAGRRLRGPACLVGVVFAVGCVVLASAATCPPLQSKTVVIDCLLDDKVVDCTSQRAAVGTLARFRCKPLHQFVFDYLPASGYESRCGKAGEWTVMPFRCVPICGRPTGKPTALVRGGEKVTSAADFPWHVTIYDRTRRMEQICGGSLITPKFFVSAAHCFHDDKKAQPASRFVAVFAKTKRTATISEPNTQQRTVKSIHLHEQYGARKLHFANDIALAELVEEVEMTAWTLPVCVDWALDHPELSLGEKGMVVGFGSVPGQPSEDLRYALLPYIPKDTCRKNVPNVLAIFSEQSDKFCVGYVDGKTVSTGDSGGGMSFPSERQWFLRGVVSVGSPKDTTYSFYTNVTAFVPWMSGIIRQGEVSGRRCGVDVDDVSVVDGNRPENNGFPWEVDIYIKKTSGTLFQRSWTGVLISPNLVLTASDTTTLGDFSKIASDINLSQLPVSWIRVGLNYTVVRTFHPFDVYVQSGVEYNLILLETEQPLRQIPVCLDWSGSALLHKRTNGTMVHERPADFYRTWKRFAILENDRCKDLLPFSNVGEQHICSYHKNFVVGSAMRGMYVNVDNSWFLRGIWSHRIRSKAEPTTSIGLYTDLNNPGVRGWLIRTRDIVGKASCGNMALCEPLAAGLSVPGRTPWSVEVVVHNSRGNTTSRAGLLVSSSAVVTDGSLVVNSTGYNGDGIVPTIATEHIDILWTDAEGTSKTSKVLQVYPRESKPGRFDVALLELDPSTPISSTPVCLDLSGNVLQPLTTGQLGLVETRGSNTNHTLHSSAIMLRTECSNILNRLSHPYAGPYTFCATTDKNAIDRNARGGGFLVQIGTKWFVHGLLTSFIKSTRMSVMVASDFIDGGIRNWLKKKLDVIPTEHKKDLADTELTSCAGIRPTSAQCGLVVERDNFELADEDEDQDKPKPAHVQWNVQVVIRDAWQRAGTLIKPNMVLTSCADLSLSEGFRVVTAAEANVKYLNSIASDWRIVEVDKIHWREKTTVVKEKSYDLAVLILKSSLPLMPVCVPAPTATALPSGTRGMVEVWREKREFQVAAVYKSRDECNALVGNNSKYNVPDGEFCMEAKSELDTLWYGAGFSVPTEDKWFLRGFVHLPFFAGKKALHELYDLDRELITWLDDIMRRTNEDLANRDKKEPFQPTANKDITVSKLNVTQSAALEASFVSTFKCGKTSVPASSVTSDAAVEARLPWSVFVVISELSVEAGGVLVRDNMVLTDGITLTNAATVMNSWTRFGDVQAMKLNTSMVRVAWINPFGEWLWSEAKALHVHEVDPEWKNYFGANIALVELETPFEGSMPVCLRLDDLPPALERLAPGQSGVISSWQGDYKENRSILTSGSLVPKLGCSRMLKEYGVQIADFVASTQFCTNKSKVEIYGGSPFLVESGGLWYVRGLAAHSWADGTGPYAWTNLDHPSIRAWLRDKLRGVVDTPRQPPSSCGVAPLRLDTLSAESPVSGALPWSVDVMVKAVDNSLHYVGTLIRHDLVLTVGAYLVDPYDHPNTTGDVFAFAPSRLRVLWFSPSWRLERSEVRAVHVHERDPFVLYDHAYDLALLELKTPFRESALPCIDLWNSLQPIQPGQKGIIPSYAGSHDSSEVNSIPLLVNGTLCSNSQKLVPDLTSGRFCTSQRPDEPSVIMRGAGVYTEAGGRLFVRGVEIKTFGVHGPHVYVKLEEPSVKTWLRKFVVRQGQDDDVATLSASDPDSDIIWFPDDGATLAEHR